MGRGGTAGGRGVVGRFVFRAGLLQRGVSGSRDYYALLFFPVKQPARFISQIGILID